MFYSSKRNKFIGFLKSRNTSFYIAILLIFIAVIAITVISIKKFKYTPTQKSNSSTTEEISSDEENVTTKSDSVGVYKLQLNLSNNELRVYNNDNIIRKMPASINSDIKTGTLTTDEQKSKRVTWYEYEDEFFRFYTDLGADIVFHSAGYTTNMDKNSLIVDEYNMIGKSSDIPGVTLTVEDAKWIFEHCSSGSVIEVIDSDSTSKLNVIEIPNGITWDPTDDSDGSPWCKTEVKSLNCANTINVDAGTDISILRQKIKALDINDNDVTDSVLISGDLNLNKAGTYNITLIIADLKGNVFTKNVTVIVNEEKETETTTEEISKEDETTEESESEEFETTAEEFTTEEKQLTSEENVISETDEETTAITTIEQIEQ